MKKYHHNIFELLTVLAHSENLQKVWWKEKFKYGKASTSEKNGKVSEA